MRKKSIRQFSALIINSVRLEETCKGPGGWNWVCSDKVHNIIEDTECNTMDNAGMNYMLPAAPKLITAKKNIATNVNE